MPQIPQPALVAIAWGSSLLFAVSLVAPIGFHFRRMRWAMRGAVLLVLEAALDGAGASKAAALVAMALALISVDQIWRWRRESQRFKTRWLERFAAQPPLRLALPFEGRWKALGTGPSIARNHHLTARDQWFAVDLVHADGASRGARVLAPADGVVAYVEDSHTDKPSRRWIQGDRKHPAGNYVSLNVNGVHVLLAHLEQGSIAVQQGQAVRAGELIGRCGNSGNTSVPHLHVHAQPMERMAPGADWGLPIVFGDAESWLEPGTVLAG